MTLRREDRLKILAARRAELFGLICMFGHKPGNEAFISEVNDRLTVIEQEIADVEFLRA